MLFCNHNISRYNAQKLEQINSKPTLNNQSAAGSAIFTVCRISTIGLKVIADKCRQHWQTSSLQYTILLCNWHYLVWRVRHLSNFSTYTILCWFCIHCYTMNKIKQKNKNISLIVCIIYLVYLLWCDQGILVHLW